MLTSRCRQLRPLLTSYVDDEVSGADRLVVQDHLSRCRACRRRLLRQNAVHQLLHTRAADARGRGTPVPWSPRTHGPLDRGPSRTLLSLSILATAVVVGIVIWSRVGGGAVVPLTARGQISDSVCRGTHSHPGTDLMSMSDRDCVGRCVEKGAQYVFVSDGVVYPIRNQRFGDLQRFAAQDIQLEGEVWGNQLTVSHIRSLDHVAQLRSAPLSSATAGAGRTSAEGANP